MWIPWGQFIFMDGITVYLKQNAFFTCLLNTFDHKNTWSHLQATDTLSKMQLCIKI